MTDLGDDDREREHWSAGVACNRRDSVYFGRWRSCNVLTRALKAEGGDWSWRREEIRQVPVCLI